MSSTWRITATVKRPGEEEKQLYNDELCVLLEGPHTDSAAFDELLRVDDLFRGTQHAFAPAGTEWTFYGKRIL